MYDIIVVGAGPVGLLFANILKNSDLNIAIFEKKETRDTHSKAIGISPPSLDLLRTIGILDDFLKNGVKVKKAIIHGSKKILGKLEFNSLDYPFNFILSIPQVVTETILENNLRDAKNITLYKNYEVIDAKIEKDNSIITTKNLDKTLNFSAKFILASDGKASKIREIFNIPFVGNRYKETFLMGDFIDETNFQDDAHLFFTKNGPVESFPLPFKKRRWIVATENFLKDGAVDYLIDKVKELTSIKLDKKNNISISPFGVQHYLNKFYYYRNIIFCGDSAHVMSPIGGQGMNTGFADAELAALILKKIIINKENKEYLFKIYRKNRQKAAKVATKRAEISMKIGTLKGTIPSAIRNYLIKMLLKPLEKTLAKHFSMLTIPFNRAKDRFI